MGTPPGDIALGATLTAEQARTIYAQGEDAVVFALLTLAKQVADQKAVTAATSHQTPATPSGMKPPYQKPVPRGRRKKKRGGQYGHRGHCRPSPARIEQRKIHRAACCPECGSGLRRCRQTRTRYTEDIPADLHAEVTEHTIHRDWCPQCRKKVEPVVPEALPNATLGNRTLVFTAWLPYALGTTVAQILEVFNFHLQLKLTAGGLVHMWQRLAEVLAPWYEEIGQQARDSAVLHADETGWRVNGKTHWLWCFANPRLTYFLIDRSRGSPVLLEFFGDEFAGTLVSDFGGAYNMVACAARQMCLVHLLRDLKHVEQYKSTAQDWPAFAKQLRRLVGDAIRLWRRRAECGEDTYATRRQRLNARLQQLIDTPWANSEAKRLVKRLRRHHNDLFTFVDQAEVPFENNLAERAIRPAVLMRKTSYGNQSAPGADTQAILMSIFRTLKQRGCHPIETTTNALTHYLQTGKLPPFPPPPTADD
jgi:transposase